METKDLILPQIEEEDELELESFKRLNPRQQRFTHLYMSGQYTLTQIKDLLHVSMSTIRSWLRNPEIKHTIEQYQDEEDEIVKQGLKALRLKAMYKMNELMDSKIDGIAYQASRDVLDRTGHKAPTKQEVTVEVKTFEQQLSELLTEKQIDSDIIEGDAVIVEPEWGEDSGEEKTNTKDADEYRTDESDDE